MAPTCQCTENVFQFPAKLPTAGTEKKTWRCGRFCSSVLKGCFLFSGAIVIIIFFGLLISEFLLEFTYGPGMSTVVANDRDRKLG